MKLTSIKETSNETKYLTELETNYSYEHDDKYMKYNLNQIMFYD